MEFVELLQLTLSRVSAIPLVTSIVFGLLTGLLLVRKFNMTLKQIILSSLLTVILFIILAVEAYLNRPVISDPGTNGAVRSTNGILGLIYYLIFLACSSIGAKTEAEITDEDYQGKVQLREDATDLRRMIREEVAAEGAKERQVIRQENAVETSEERKTMNVNDITDK